MSVYMMCEVLSNIIFAERSGARFGALVVAEGDHVHGIVSERDVVLVIAAGNDLDSATAGDVDSRRLVSSTPDTTVQAAGVLMMENYVGHLLVSDQTGPVGMVSARDLLGAYVA